jgi:hypothetical protein
MAYIKIVPISGMNSQARCEAINKELFAITRPYAVRNENDVTNKVFGEIRLSDGVWALDADLEYIFTVHPQRNIQPLAALFPDLSPTEKGQLIGFIENSQRFVFKYIITSGTVLYNREQLIADGLITVEE